MRVCKKCQSAKPESEFFIRSKVTGKLHTQCKACYKERRKETYAKHYQKYKQNYLARARERRAQLRSEYRTNMLEYLSEHKCVDCDEDDIVVLEFDHLQPAMKEFGVSQAVKLGYSWNQVLTEIKKCEVVCANCHKRRTAKQFGWYKSGGTYRI